MESVQIIKFRDDGEVSTTLSWSGYSDTWICGDKIGGVHISKNYGASFEECSLTDRTVSAVSANGNQNHVSFGVDDTLQTSDFPICDGNIKATSLRKTLPITTIQYNSTGSLIFVSSQEPDVTVYNIASNKVEDNKISTNNLSVKTFLLSPDDSFVGLIDGDGNVKAFKLNYLNSATSQRAKLNGSFLDMDKHGIVGKGVTRSSKQRCKTSWYPVPNEQVALVVPGKSCVLAMVRHGENDWREHLFIDNGSSGGSAHTPGADLNIVCFSPNGKYLASADVAGRVLIWSYNAASPGTSTVVRSMSCGEALVDVVWGVKSGDNYLLLLSADGSARVDGVVDSLLPPPASVEPVEAPSPARTASTDAPSLVASAVTVPAGTIPRKRLVRNTVTAGDEDDDDAEENNLFGNTQPQAAAPRQEQSLPARISANSALAEPSADTHEDSSISLNRIKVATLGLDEEARTGSGAVVLDDDDEDEDGEYDEEDDQPVLRGASADKKLAELLARIGPVSNAVAQQVSLQPAFQPASTKPDEKMRRYLVWNHVGSITSRDESVENRIEIRFSNTIGSNKNEYFADRTGFTMAALAHEGAAFASDPEEDPDAAAGGRRGDDYFKKSLAGSTIYYHAFGGQKQLEGVNESFRYTLSNGEAVLAIAVGRGWVAVATSHKLLRIFTSTGVQTKIVWLDGPVVCLVGNDSRLAVIYHSGAPLGDASQLRVDLINISWREAGRCRLAAKGLVVPVSAGGKLSWAGFETDTLLLTVLDSRGILSVLTKSGPVAWDWVPALDTNQARKSVDHVCWPVMVRGDKFVFVLLNGESRPDVHPLPVVTTRPLRLPLASIRDGKEVGDTHSDKLHELLWGDVKHDHCEALRDECNLLGAAAFGIDQFAELEERLAAQENAADTLVLKMFQDACQQQRLPLALNLALKLRTERALAGAVKVANYFGRTSVASAVDAMLQHKQAAAREAEEQQHHMSSENSPVSYGYDYNSAEFQEGAEGIAPADSRAGSLSGRLAKSQLPPSGRNVASSKVVSPPAATATSESGVVAMNPFAVRGSSSASSTPVKRKDPFTAIQDLRESPSPLKKPNTNTTAVLNRQSTFSQNARQQKLMDKTIL